MDENYKNALLGLNWYVNRLSQIPEYHESWSADFCVKESLEYRDKLDIHLTEKVDFTKLNLDELKSLGFEEFGKTLLCPLWLADHLFPNVDHDNRGGLIAFGFAIDGENIIFNKSTI